MPSTRQVVSALKGDQNAAAALARSMLKDQREELAQVKAVIDQQRAENWNEEATREACINGEIPEEVSTQAWYEVHDQLVEITSQAPLALLSKGGEGAEVEEAIKQDLMQLAVKLANPTIKYGLIALIEPENREVVIENLHYTANELWQTAWVLTDPGEIKWSDFPPDTETAIRAALDEQERQANQQGADDD